MQHNYMTQNKLFQTAWAVDLIEGKGLGSKGCKMMTGASPEYQILVYSIKKKIFFIFLFLQDLDKQGSTVTVLKLSIFFLTSWNTLNFHSYIPVFGWNKQHKQHIHTIVFDCGISFTNFHSEMCTQIMERKYRNRFYGIKKISSNNFTILDVAWLDCHTKKSIKDPSSSYAFIYIRQNSDGLSLTQLILSKHLQ